MEIIDKLRKGFLLIAVCLVCLGQTIAQTTVAKIGSDEYTTLQAAVDAAYEMTGDVTIEIVQDINGDYAVVREKNNLNLTIDGNNHTMNGQILVDGNGTNSSAGLTIQNVTFAIDLIEYTMQPESSGIIYFMNCNCDYGAIYWCGTNPDGYWMQHGISNPTHNSTPWNVTIRNCTFNLPEYIEAVQEIVAIKSVGRTNVHGLVLDNLVASKGHSLAQLQTLVGDESGRSLLVSNCQYISETNNGINITGGEGTFIIQNNEITAPDGYALRVQNQNQNACIVELNDNTFNSKKGLILKGNTAVGDTVYIKGGIYVGNDCITDSDSPTNLYITGGTFSCDVNNKCALGYAAYEDEGSSPQTWTVLKMNWLTFDANGGAGLDSVIYFIPTSAQTYTPVANNWFTHSSGYDFKCWNTKADGSGTDIYPGATMTITSDTVLYAKWKVVARIGSTDYPTLQAAVDAAYEMTGDITIKILDTVTEWALVKQKASLNLTIDGQDNTMLGQILIDGMSHHTGTETLTIQNINFKYDAAGFAPLMAGATTTLNDQKAFIYFPNQKSKYLGNNNNYAHNVTIQYCTFDGIDRSANYPIRAIYAPNGAGTPYNVTLDHLTATHVFTPVGMYSVQTSLTITNVKASDVQEGITVSGGEGPVTITNDTIVGAQDLAIRLREINGRTFNLADNYFDGENFCIQYGKNPEGSTVNIASGFYKGKFENGWPSNDDHTAFSVTGGTFTNLGGADDAADSTNIKSKCATGYGCYKDVAGYPAGWTVLKQYVVTYNANGGDGEMAPSYATPLPGSSFTVKDNEFTWDVAFSNWNTKADGTGDTYAPGATMTISSDTTLYAQWNIVAKIGDNVYPSLQAAVNDAKANLTGDVTIDLVQNTTEWVLIVQKAGLNLTIDGHNDTIFGQIIIDGEARDCGTETLDIKNLSFKYHADGFYSFSTSAQLTNGFIVTPTNMAPADAPYFPKNNGRNYVYSHNITVTNCTFDGAGSSYDLYAYKGAWGSNSRNIKLDNCTAKNVFGFAFFAGVGVCPAAVGYEALEISNCTATENVTQALFISGGGDQGKSPLATFTIKDNTFDAENVGVYIANAVYNPTYNFSGNTIVADTVFQLKLNDNGDGGPVSSNSVINITDGTYKGLIDDFDPETHLNISGGTYSEDVSGEPCAPGYAAFDNGDGTWTVTKAWFLYYDKNHVTAVGTMDTLFVRQDGTDVERTVEVAACEFTCLPDSAFDRWNTQADGLGDDVSVGTELELTSDVTLYAIWKEGFTIFYNNNGGTGEIANQSKDPGVDVTLSDGAAFSRTDNTLYRWNTAEDESGTNYKLGGTYSEDANVTMYAVWRLNLGMTMSSTDVVCYGENNGTDTVKIIGGDPTYMIVLSSTVLAQNDTVRTSETQYVFTNLKPGDYSVELTDTLKKDVITGTFTIHQPDTLVASFVSVPNAPCPLMGTGTYAVSMTTTGGNGGNVITWGGDATDVDASETTVTPDADDRDRTYNITVTVTDQKGCVATATADFTVAPVIANDGTSHSNTTMTVAPISHSILYGCDTVLRDFGTPEFVFTNAAITDAIIDTVYNNVYTIAPDSIFAVGGDYTILWTAVDTCGHTVTAEQVISITHKSCPTVTDRDGNSYPAVRIGCDCWTTKNLASTHYSSDGTEIPDVMTYSATRTRSRAVPEYGYLYTYSAAMHGETVTGTGTTPVQGACPDGWHIPTAAESEALMASTEVRDLMSQGLWIPDNGTNASGFNLLPGGCYNAELDRYERMYVSAYFWIAVPDSYVYHACEFGAACSSTELVPGNLSNGFSIRCVLTKPAE